MQKTLVTLQKKEQYAKKALFDSQVRWTAFSGDIARQCKELIAVLESKQVIQYKLPQEQQPKLLEHVKQRLAKQDAFL